MSEEGKTVAEGRVGIDHTSLPRILRSADLTPEDLEWARARLDAHAIAIIEAAERQRCVEDVCIACRRGIPTQTNVAKAIGMLVHAHDNGAWEVCRASAIHERASLLQKRESAAKEGKE